jgi:hypothetical protein
MLFYSVVAILKAYTDISFDSWFFNSSKLRLVIATAYTVAIIMLILWLLGIVTSNTMGGFIHILFVIAVVVLLIRLIQGRRVL